ncbi:YfhO family protein [Liquorilactobacillus vini]|uniref:Integral membrane protein n=1 Tax=Liquorilactobacillus vini DSM 20605 TaxID=1133569 RepID=A0A0R2CD83_9LACO|nr:YfhO family protein [Liquorilactobacillus vini]KRM89248.1 hypothetical protein FD21_GL002136 [Liquorilactobacillus vini DSM 20605]
MKTKISNFFKLNYAFILSFFIPLFLMSCYFISRQMYPFGSNSLLTVDLGQQYVDFFAFFRNTLLHHPSSFFYSFSKALGGEMLGEWAYYLLSPFNLLLLLFPAKNIDAAIFLITILKYGSTGLSFAWFIKKTQMLTDLKVIMLSVSYALMGWFVSYQLNLLWLDAAILLPLVCYFLNRLLLDQKQRLGFSIVLALTLIINYYMAYMICIFLALYFFWLSVSNWTDFKSFVSRLLKFISASILAAGLAAVIILPTFYSLLKSKGQYTQQVIHFKFEYFPFKMLAKLVIGTFNFQQMPSGLPNIFLGSLGLIGFIAYFGVKQIAGREKVAALLISAFLFLSLCFEPLDLFWHGMQFPVWYPYRFSFIVTFWMLLLAGRALTKLTWPCWGPASSSLIIYAAILGYTYLNRHQFSFVTTKNLWLSCFFATIIWLLLFIHWHSVNFIKWLLLLAAVVAEVTINAYFSLNNLSYLSQKEYQQPTNSLAADAKKLKQLDHGFYRTGQVYSRTKNDGIAHDLYAGSYFSSAMEKSIPDFYGQLGDPDGDNYVTYSNGTLISDALLGMKYFIAPKQLGQTNNGQPLNQLTEKPDLKTYQKVGSTKLTEIYRNSNSLPFAYLANQQLLQFKNYYDDPINFQTQWLAQATGHLSDQYFVPQNFNEVVFQNVNQQLKLTDAVFKRKNLGKVSQIIFKFTPTTNDSYYLTLGASLDSDNATFYLNNQPLSQYETFRHTVVVNLANHAKGQEIVLTVKFKKPSLWLNHFVLYRMKNQLVEKRIRQLKSQQPQVKKLSERSLTINFKSTKQKQLVATTIPYAQGWQAKINGQKTSLKKIQGMFIGIMTHGKGRQRITLIYQPPYLMLGLIITLISLGCCLIVTWLWQPVKRRNR